MPVSEFFTRHVTMANVPGYASFLRKYEFSRATQTTCFHVENVIKIGKRVKPLLKMFYYLSWFIFELLVETCACVSSYTHPAISGVARQRRHGKSLQYEIIIVHLQRLLRTTSVITPYFFIIFPQYY